MSYNLLGKEVRGRFGFPSGVIATNPDTARCMLRNIPQLGFYVGKSTTIEPKDGNPEDIFLLLDSGSGCNAVGYANPGLESTVEGFRELIGTAPKDVFLMPQIGESDEARFAHCAAEFDKIGIDGIELNVSCPHAKEGGILIGSSPEMVHSIVSAARKATKKPLVVKLNAAVSNIEDIAKAAVNAGANGISAINTLGGPFSELSNRFGGLSGPSIFPVTYRTVERIRNVVNVPMIVMGGICGANSIRSLDKISQDFFYAIGTSLAELDSEEIFWFFSEIDYDLKYGTNKAEKLIEGKKVLQYEPFIVTDIQRLSDSLRLIRFDKNLEAFPAQFVFLKTDNEHSKPFSIANFAQDRSNLELVVRKVGDTTSKIFGLKENNVVRIRGPYGKPFLEGGSKIIYVGAGCGIAPVHHAAAHNKYNGGERHIFIGAKTAGELVYLRQLKDMGAVFCSTDDGTAGFKGTVVDLVRKQLEILNPGDDFIFFNCGPEVVLRELDKIGRQYASPERIHHLVERMTSCGTGICGKCSIPNGERACVDGPVFLAEEFSPGSYRRGKDGRKINI